MLSTLGPSVLCGTFWTKSELFLKKIQNRKRNASHAISRTLRSVNKLNHAIALILRATARQKPFPFQFFVRLLPRPLHRKRKKGKEMVLSVGFAQKFQNDFLKTSFIAYAIRKSFFHFFTNYGATPVVNLKSAHSRETPRMATHSVRNACSVFSWLT